MASSLPFSAIVIFILIGIGISTGLFFCVAEGCKCRECKNPLNFLFFLCWLISLLFLFGGLWIKMDDFENYQIDCCNFNECCEVG